MDSDAEKAYEDFRKMLGGQTPREFAGERRPWKRPEDSPLYVDLSDMNAVSNEMGVITTFPMHRRRFKVSKHIDPKEVLIGADKCRVFGHTPIAEAPEATCAQCGKTRAELEAVGEIWDGKGSLKGIKV
jgi:hypothetical protein